MNNHFRCIGIVGHPRHPTALTTHEMLYRWLCGKGYEVMVEQQIAQELQLKSVRTGTLAEIGQQADLAVVVGGDGNMLGAARTLARYDIKVIGINRGNLGFLTDLDPDNAQQQLADVLEGHYISEKRFLLEAQVCQQDCQKRISTAINEVVLHPGKVAHMIEFEVYIDEIFAFSQRSDGLIISTPTGSTAYSLSAGGPILTPSLDAITLVPMFPHTLSARPLVINGDSTIRLRFSHRRNDLEISCDSQIALPIQEGEDVLIRRCDYHLNLIHPKDYSYFNTLSSKLGWSKNCSDFASSTLLYIKPVYTVYKHSYGFSYRKTIMLAQLTISNFAIVRELEIDFHSGMTAITGETGAGKSIAIDALGLCLGGRAEGDMVRTGAARADLCARFSLKDTPAALRWLEANQLEDGRECLLRRVISSDGRSRGFINGTAVPLSQLRELGQLLIQIHGQHAHQQLIKPEQQKALLDGYAGEYALTQLMAEHYRQWHQSCRELAQHQQQSQERTARAELLEYQLKELNEFNPQAGEFEQIDEEYKRLANSGQLLSISQTALNMLADGEDVNLQSQLYNVRQLVTELTGMDNKLSGVLEMLEEAAIQISEAGDELRHYCERLDLDPNRLFELEQRISRQISLARKHHVTPEELPNYYQSLLEEQQQLDDQADSLETLSLAVNLHHQQALETAKRLHDVRQHYALELSQHITDSMHTLAMPHGVFTIDVRFEENHLTAEGADRVEFRVTTNSGPAFAGDFESGFRR